MKESKFIEKNMDGWKENESLLSKKNNTPRKLSNIFIKTTDDLSYSYTFYKNRSVRLYLNSVAKILYNRINKSEQFRFSNIKKFFSYSVPLAMYEARKEILVSFILFAVSMLIGVLSSKYDTEFAQLILGDDYIKMTQENIANNDPMAVYKSRAPFDMFFGITINNCLIAFRTFVLGIFMAVGTVIIMIHNGIMVGTFQYFFIEQGMFRDSFLTIWQHGVFEISSIIMAGASGLVLGKGLIFPGNFTRSQALRISARKGLKLLMGIFPILIIAAFIEGYYTRFTQTPDIIRITTILLSLMVIIGYFVGLPWYRNKQITTNEEISDYLEPPETAPNKFDDILSISELFMETFQQIKNQFGVLLKWALLFALILPISVFLLSSLNLYIFSENAYYFAPANLITEHFPGIGILLVSFIGLSVCLVKIEISDKKAVNPKHPVFAKIIQVFLLQVVVHSTLLLPSPVLAILLYICLLIISTLALNVYSKEPINMIHAIIYSFRYLKKSFSKFISLSFRFLVMGTLFYFIFNKLIISLNNEFIQMNIYGTQEQGLQILSYVNTFYFSFMVLFIFAVFFLANQVLYYSLFETIHASGLQNRIKSIGKTNRIRGLIRE